MLAERRNFPRQPGNGDLSGTSLRLIIAVHPHLLWPIPARSRSLDGSSGGIEHDRPPQGKDHVMRASCTFAVISLLATASALSAAEEERKIDPTFLHRNTAGAKEAQSDITAPGCHYKPLFADAVPGSGVARFAIVTLDAGASCKSVSYPGEDQIYVVLNGSGAASYGGEQVALAKEDFLVLPA